MKREVNQMKRTKLRLRLAVAATTIAMIVTTAGAFACTGVYIGKNVSKEGTTVIARSEDRGTSNYEKMFKVQKRVTKSGRYLKDTGESQKGFKVPLPKTTYKYTFVPDNTGEGDGMYPASCTNEYGLAVVGTVSAGVNDKYAKADPYKKTGTGLREAILPALIACQCKTARGAVDKLAALTTRYGSEEGNILFFADKTGAWIFESYGGHQYCAMKLPANKVAVFGNQFMIGTVDKTNTSGYVFSKGLFKALDKAGAVMENGKYNITRTVSGDYSRTDYSTMRTWMGHRLLAPSTAGSYDSSAYYPLCYKPDSKVSVLDVMKLYRNRYEGTSYDMTKSENKALRPIGVNTQSDVHIIQIYNSLPKDTCCVQWLCMGNAEDSVFIPSFSGITDTYSGYKVNAHNYNAKSLYWNFKSICTLAETDRAYLGKGVRAYWQSQEKKMLSQLPSQIRKTKAAYKKGQSSGRAYVTALGKKTASMEVSNAKRMYSKLIKVATYNQTDASEEMSKIHFKFK